MMEKVLGEVITQETKNHEIMYENLRAVIQNAVAAAFGGK